MSENPYSPPRVEIVAPVAAEDRESLFALRRKFLWRESFVKVLGLYHLLWGCLILVSSGGFFIGAREAGEEALPIIIGGLVMAAFGLGLIVIGLGVRRLSPAFRIVAAVIQGLSLLAIPIGTLSGTLFLILLLNKKGKAVFSANYHEAIKHEPRVSRWLQDFVWFMVLFFVSLVEFLFVLAWFSKMPGASQN